MSAGLVTTNGYYAAITMEIHLNCSISNRIEIGLRKKPDSYDITGEMPPALLEKCKTYCSGLNIEMSDGPWWHIMTHLPLETSDDILIDHLKALEQFATKELK